MGGGVEGDREGEEPVHDPGAVGSRGEGAGCHGELGTEGDTAVSTHALLHGIRR